jgi:hypothetical protein
MGKNWARGTDPKTGRAIREYLRHARGAMGEQNIAFWLGDKGFLIIEGPSGIPLKGSVGAGAGHAVTASGFDGIAFNPHTGEMIIYDNKSLARAGNAGSASAITRNLADNLDKAARRIRKRIAAGANFPHSAKVLKQLDAARKAVASGGKWPGKVALHLYNAGGKNITGVTGSLAARGIKFIDYYAAERIKRPLSFNPAMKSMNTRLRRAVVREERRAGVKLTEKAVAGIERRVAKLAQKKGVAFARKALPKLAARAALKVSARQAAKRAASLLPIIGWGFAADDIYKGCQDALRGEVARGLGGVGLGIADVASDFLHIGDAVTGVGGTALSIAAQGGTIAGQIAIEVDRFNDKMKELGEEIARNDNLPDVQRLKDYYDLDDEGIQELQTEFAKPDEGPVDDSYYDPPPPVQLPPEFELPGSQPAVAPPAPQQGRPPTRPASPPSRPVPSPAPAPAPTPRDLPVA